jgi:hypothetical protein
VLGALPQGLQNLSDYFLEQLSQRSNTRANSDAGPSLKETRFERPVFHRRRLGVRVERRLDAAGAKGKLDRLKLGLAFIQASW